jgi:cytochrome bd ubiquinol oxidase subunit II
MIDLHILWFLLLGVLMAGYGVLDGFDLGVGIVHLFVKDDLDRRAFMNAIGPIWDGNEVWLVVFGGALFAAFPPVYAAAFTGFYAPFMMLLFALIFRGVSLEFRSKKQSKWWRGFWDIAFSFASTAAAFIFGVAVGGTLRGVPIDGAGSFVGKLEDLFQPFPMIVGLFAVATCALHGTIYLYLKLEGDLQKRLHNWMWSAFGFFIICYIFTTIMTLIFEPHATTNFKKYPLSWIVVFLQVLAIANIPRSIFLNKPLQAFVSSACTIIAFTFLFGIALFPNLLTSSLNPEWSLTVYNASSSPLTLKIMTIMAAIGLPFVVTYTAVIYWVFRGKVKREHLQY